jgi:hypothetical protein
MSQFSAHRVPYHYQQAHMYKEMIEFLRSVPSRSLSASVRRSYIHVSSYIEIQLLNDR